MNLRNKRCLFATIFAFGLVLLNGDCSWGQPTPIRFSTVPFIGEAPSYVAYEMGFFREEGLAIKLKFNPGGWMSLKDLFEGKADIATVAELPIVYSALDKKKYTEFERGDFCIVGDMIYSQQDVQQIIARKDRGISSPLDLKGKKIGVFKGTTLDYFMDIFFKENGIQYSDIEIVDMNVFKLTDAIVNGDLDAIFTWQPHAYRARKRLGENAIVLHSKFKYSTAWLIVVMKSFAEKNPQVLEKFLKAIVKAEKFIKENPEQAKIIHAKLSKTDQETTNVLWDVVDFDLSLGEGLLITMEGEARWLIRKGVYGEIKVPDFLDYLYFDAMKKVKPQGIQIIR